jgi:hypothetical protein
MYTHFKERDMPRHITPPKWDEPLITPKEPNKISSRCIRLKANTHK